jgi:uncharacterized protein YciI
MALFAALIAFTENEELRLQTRPVHREYLRSLLDAGKLSMSGPWADDTGALIIYEAEDMAEAERILDGDPYRERHTQRVEGSLEGARGQRRPVTSSAMHIGSPARFAP